MPDKTETPMARVALDRIEELRALGTVTLAMRLVKLEHELTAANQRAQEAGRILNEPFHSGTRITNCISHSGLSLTERPEDCRLCRTDIVNQLSLAITINEFLNAKVEKALSAIDAARSAKEGT